MSLPKLMPLTSRQKEALLAAHRNDGQLFQLPERRTHAPGVLAALVKLGLLKSESVGVIWTLTDEGRRELTAPLKAKQNANAEAIEAQRSGQPEIPGASKEHGPR